MNTIYLKLIYIFNLSIILFIFLIGKDISAEQNATIIADEIRSDNNTNVVDAKGDVIILNHDGTKIKADNVTYDNQKQKIEASGNIIINDLSGNTYFLNNAITFDGLNQLEGNNVQARMTDSSRIVSKDILKNDNITLLTEAEYTPSN